MDKLILGFGVLIASIGFTAEYKAEIVKKWTLPADFTIDKKKIGGMSGCSVLNDRIYFVIDDRGREYSRCRTATLWRECPAWLNGEDRPLVAAVVVRESEKGLNQISWPRLRTGVNSPGPEFLH